MAAPDRRRKRRRRHESSLRARQAAASREARRRLIVRERSWRYLPLAGVKKPVTVPEMVKVPSGLVNVFSAAGMSHVTVPFV
jgi:hypothetical protein